MSTPTPTPTPRTDAAWSATFDGEQMSAGQTARALREFSQQLETELAELTAERDHWQKIAVSASREREHNANVAQAMTAERDQLRAELATERARLRQLALDACRAAAIVPVVWYPTGYYVNPNDLGKINKQQVDACVAAIDAAMKEDAK